MDPATIILLVKLGLITIEAVREMAESDNKPDGTPLTTEQIQQTRALHDLLVAEFTKEG